MTCHICKHTARTDVTNDFFLERTVNLFTGRMLWYIFVYLSVRHDYVSACFKLALWDKTTTTTSTTQFFSPLVLI